MNDSGMFPLPESLRSEAAELIDRERRDAERQQSLKRYGRGVMNDDLTGFALNGQQLRKEQIPSHLRDRRSKVAVTRVPGQVVLDSSRHKMSWLELAANLQIDLAASLSTQPQYRELLASFRDRGQVPEWLDAVATHRGQRVFDPVRAAPHFKFSDEVLVQATYIDAVVSARPELSKFFVPLIAFEVSPKLAMCVMPFLSDFVTLDHLICVASGLRESGPGSIQREEAGDVVEEAVRQLGEIFQVARGKSPVTASIDFVVNKMQERFSVAHDVPLLIGEQLLGAMRGQALGAFEQNLKPLWQATAQEELAFGHGDLNATNIMVAVRRNSAGKIVDVCVRLIDPNPEGVVGHTYFELARLVHWVELGLPLRLSGEAPKPLMELRFAGSEIEEEFLNRSPRLVVHPAMRTALEPIYARMWEALRRAFPSLREPDGEQTLTLGTAFFHLVATKYWPRNLERTCAFWAGMGELQTLSGMSRVVESDGLWPARRRLRGWRS